MGAIREVTGSCALITVGKYRILVDCGLLQGSLTFERHNRDEFKFEPSDIDAVIVTHAHIDHSGRTPLLVKRGYTGPIYSHHATVDLCKIMLPDSGFLNEKQAQWENRRNKSKNKDPIEPLYTLVEAQDAQRNFQGVAYDTPTEILPGITVIFRDAGHILGSAIVEIILNESGKTRTIVFSGDLGRNGTPILCDPSVITRADLVVMESTYGDRQHRGWDQTWEELGAVIESAKSEKGNILIPAFTVGRTQELLYMFREHYDAWGLDNWQIFLDSPMAIEATKIYAKHRRIYDNDAQTSANSGSIFDLPNLHMTETTEESMGINRIRTGAIIIAGSGMCTGGRIRHHLQYNVARKGTHVIIVGFQARGTPGRALVDGTSQLHLFGEDFNVAAKVHTIGGLSAHADQQELLNWYGNFENQPPVYLVHGEETAMLSLQHSMKTKFNSQVTLAEYDKKIVL